MVGAFLGRTQRKGLSSMYIVLFFVVECLRRLKGRREKKRGREEQRGEIKEEQRGELKEE